MHSVDSVDLNSIACNHILYVLYVCVCVCVFYEDTNLYNNMGMTYVLQGEGDLWGHFQCPHNLKRL